MANRLIEIVEPFTFADGSVRLAIVTWRIGDGERRAVGVKSLPGDPPVVVSVRCEVCGDEEHPDFPHPEVA